MNDIKKSGSTSEIHALTGVRGVAALWVVVFHLAIFLPNLNVGARSLDIPAIGLGYTAVDLFFVLSGFVLALTQRERFSFARVDRVTLFLVARILRLYPLHWLVLGLFVLAVLVSPGRHLGLPPYTGNSFAATATLVQTWIGDHSNAWNTPSWSISAELVAYALFPLLFELGRRVSVAWAAAGLSAAMIALLAAVLTATGSMSLEHTWRLGIVRCVLEFSAGVFLFRFAVLIGRDCIHGNAAFAFGAAIIAVIILFPAGQLAVPLGFGLLILSCYAPAGIATWLLGNRVVLFLGKISFSIYLVHFLVLILADDLAERLQLAASPVAIRYAWIAMQLIGILLLATMTWRWIERPGQRLSHQLRQHIARRFAASQG